MPFLFHPVKQGLPIGGFENNIKKMLRAMELLCEYQNRLNDLEHINKHTGLNQEEQQEARCLTKCMNNINAAIKNSKLLDTILEQEQQLEPSSRNLGL